MSVNPENYFSGWQVVEVDGQTRLRDFDFDERGYIYLAYSFWGFGIVDLNGTLISQRTVDALNYYAPVVIMTFAESGKQYLLVSDAQPNDSFGPGVSAIYDVSDPSTPVYVRSLLSGAITGYARNAAGTEIAVIRATGGTIAIYTPSELIADATPHATVSPETNRTWADITSDGTNFYAVQNGGGATISLIAPEMAGYTTTNILNVAGAGTDLTYRSGYLAYIGVKTSGTSPPPFAVLYAIDGDVRTAYDISSYLRSTYTYPYYNLTRQAVVFCTDTGSAAMFALYGLGDVYSINDGVAPCAPAPPGNVVVTAGDASASISFDPPASDGGSPVTGYIVYSNPDNIRTTGSGSPINVNGLTNGTSYTFTVTATNSVGATSSAPTNAVAPFGPPAWVYASGDGASVGVLWQSINAHQYDVLRGTTVSNLAHYAFVNTSSFQDTDVQPGTAYLYAIQAIDDADVHSASSKIDYAIPFDFTPVASGVPIAATHMTELKDAANALRAAAELDPIDFTSPVQPGVPIVATNLTDLLTAINDARKVFGLPAAFPFGNPLGAPLFASYILQLRNTVN